MAAPLRTQKSILIVSSSVDVGHTKPVADILKQRGFRVILFEVDKIAKGVIPFEISIQDAGLSVSYNNETLNFSDIDAAWFRKPYLEAINVKDAAKRMGLEREVKDLLEVLWSALPKHVWLNHPTTITEWERRKLSQLLLAQSLGLVTPATVVSNRWQNVLDHLPSEEVVLKMAMGILYAGSSEKSLYTTILSNTTKGLPVQTNPFPGIWQSYLPKRREWRITVVGKQVFTTAIYTNKQARDDWRKHQHLQDQVQFTEDTFPQAYKEKCLQMLTKMNLRYGAFDFIEDDEGKLIFLEVNPNGQYAWVETTLGTPISNAVAKELERIAYEH